MYDLVMVSWTGGSSFSSSPRVTITDQTNVGLVNTRKIYFLSVASTMPNANCYSIIH